MADPQDRPQEGVGPIPPAPKKTPAKKAAAKKAPAKKAAAKKAPAEKAAAKKAPAKKAPAKKAPAEKATAPKATPPPPQPALAAAPTHRALPAAVHPAAPPRKGASGVPIWVGLGVAGVVALLLRRLRRG